MNSSSEDPVLLLLSFALVMFVLYGVIHYAVLTAIRSSRKPNRRNYLDDAP